MNRRWIAGAALGAMLLVPCVARAHEGHPHKVMGFVTARHERHVQVKDLDGKSADITLNDKTKIVRGNHAVPLDDIRPGDRIVVTAVQTKNKEGKVTMVATEVKLGPAETPGAKVKER